MQLVAALACVVLAWRAIRAVTSGVVWRAYPVLGLGLAGLLLGYGTAVAVALIVFPEPVAIGVAAIAFVLAAGLAGTPELQPDASRASHRDHSR